MLNRFILSPFFLDQPLAAAERLASSDWMINKPALPEGTQIQRMSEVHRHLADLVAAARANGHRPVSVAGDCCTTIAVLAGLQRGGVDPLLVWLDAHGDFNTWETSPSGFVGGMPLAMIVGRGEHTLLQSAAMTPLREHDVYLVNARDLDPKERVALQQSNVRHVADPAALVQLLAPERPLYIHLDIDVLDPREAPAVAYAAPGGPAASALREMARTLANTGRVIALSLTLWDLKADVDQHTERASMALFNTLLGHT